MPIKLRWFDQKQFCIYAMFSHPANEFDWYNAVSRLSLMFNEVTHPVNVLLDMSNLSQLPFDVIEAINVERSRFHTNHATQVVLINQELCPPMRVTLMNTDPVTGTYIASSPDEAMQIFMQHTRRKKST